MNEPRPIAIFASSFAPHLGGVEELCRRLAIEQRSRGRDTIVITNRFPKQLPAHEVINGIPVHRARFRVPEPRGRHLAGWVAGTAAARHQVRRALEAHRVGLIHVQCVSSNGYYALRAARATGLPLVVTLQGELTMDANAVYQHSAMLRSMWRQLLQHAEVVTGCSQQVVDEAIATFGPALTGKARAVPNGVDLEAIRGAEPESRDRPYVLGIGRFVHQKGFDLLIEAFAGLAAEFPDLDLVLAGDGVERNHLEARANASSFAKRIIFLGGVPAARAFSLFRGASAFVLSSRHEPQGIVVIEAMAAGAPVVAARVGGVPETVRHGENGLLFDGGSAPALQAALREVLSDPDATKARRARADIDVEHYTWRRIADLYHECYEQAMH